MSEYVISGGEAGLEGVESYDKQEGNEGLWRQVFQDGDPKLIKMQKFNRLLPSDPRCRLCFAPFGGIGGMYMRMRGKDRNSRNPHYCSACDGFIKAFPGGAEVDLSILFVDVRKSTQFALGAKPAVVSQRIQRFLDKVTEIIIDADGFISAFYGDCIVAAWPPGFSGKDHAKKCVQAARAMVELSLRDQQGNAIPIGIGIHTGKTYIGTVTALEGTFRDVSLFGQSVNLTARLADNAEPKEALASAEILQIAKENTNDLQKKDLSLKGFPERVTAYSLQ